jgi:hypothetical protein
MYKFITSYARGSRFEDLIYAFPKRPYPSIELRFYVRNTLLVATMEFMSVDKNATQILGWEGDWANIDEAGQLDDLGGTITNLGSRMRGSINGRERLGRLTMTSNSWDNPEMWYRYDLAVELPDDYLSLTVSTRHNKNVTPDQLRLMLKDIPEDEHDRFIDGSRPEGLGKFFSKHHVYACEDQDYGDFIVAGVKGSHPGYALQQLYGAGVVYFATPRAPEGQYMVVGDPGTGEAPNRNAPAIMVWDVTDFPTLKASMVAAWWGSGHGSITPFIYRLLKMMEIYDPIYTVVDNTATQKNTAQLLNTYLFSARSNPKQIEEWIGVDLSGVLNQKIEGLDFSGSKKPAYLIAGRLMLEANLMIWPKFFVGMRSQLTNYDPEKDKAGGPKISQDLVAAYCMAAWAIRAHFRINPKDFSKEGANPSVSPFDNYPDRATRLSLDARTLRAARSELGENSPSRR